MLNELKQSLALDEKLEITIWDPANESVEHIFPSCIKEVNDLMIRAALPGTGLLPRILPLLQPNTVTGVILDVYPSPFLFYPIIQSPADLKTGSFWLRIPETTQIETIQRRRHVRIPMSVPFMVDFVLAGKTMSIPAHTEDVSGGGLKFASQRLFLKDQELVTHLQLSPETPTLHLRSTVVFSAENRVRRHPNDLYSTACQFHDLEEAQETIIMKECFRRELGLKKQRAGLIE